jgi:hypothetical protein
VVAADLTARLPGVDVIEAPRADPPVERNRIVLAIRQVNPADVACPYARVSLDVWAVVPQTDPGGANDALDAFLGDVLGALDTMPHTTWTVADRGVFVDTHPAYRVAVERNMT